MTLYGLKHTVKCRCILSQFKKVKNPPAHQFSVFSVIDDGDNVKVKYVQCNNCGVVHKIVDVCKSEIMNSELLKSVTTIDDVKHSIMPSIADVLTTNDADLSTWENVKFIVENDRWGDFIVLSRDREKNDIIIKIMKILGKNLFTIETETITDVAVKNVK
jgi:hypothetical protein